MIESGELFPDTSIAAIIHWFVNAFENKWLTQFVVAQQLNTCLTICTTIQIIKLMANWLATKEQVLW